MVALPFHEGANRCRRLESDYKSTKPHSTNTVASVPRVVAVASSTLKPVISAPVLIGNSVAGDPSEWWTKHKNASKWGYGGRNVVAQMMAKEYNTAAYRVLKLQNSEVKFFPN